MLCSIFLSLFLNYQNLDSAYIQVNSAEGRLRYVRGIEDTTLSIYTNYIQNKKNEERIRGYNITKNIDLYHNGKIIVKPDSGYFNLYEIFKDRYIIVTPQSNELWFSSLGYGWAKNEIRIVALDDLEKVYEVNIEEKFIIDIDIDNMCIEAYDPAKNEILKYKLKRIK
ncbi:MAG: hypothetical protein GXX85_11305 [Ignavibacteria bacterium]|nr:hypothetical protein [Ignavibacteria bacterium]